MTRSQIAIARGCRATLATLLALAATAAGAATARADGPQGVPVLEPRDPAAAQKIKVRNDGIDLVDRARDRMYKRSRACWPRTVNGKPLAADAKPEAATLGLIAAFRRPGTAEERSVQPPFPSSNRVFRDYTRGAAAVGGRRFWVGITRGGSYEAPASAACRRAFDRELQRLGRKRSPAVRDAARQAYAELRRAAADGQRNVATDAIWMSTRAADGMVSGGGVIPVADFRKRGLLGSFGGGVAGETLIQGLVPDGVATVELDYPQLAEHGPLYKPTAYPSAFRATAPVQDNVIAASVPRSAHDAFPATMVWRSPSGAMIRTVPGFG